MSHTEPYCYGSFLVDVFLRQLDQVSWAKQKTGAFICNRKTIERSLKILGLGMWVAVLHQRCSFGFIERMKDNFQLDLTTTGILSIGEQKDSSLGIWCRINDCAAFWCICFHSYSCIQVVPLLKYRLEFRGLYLSWNVLKLKHYLCNVNEILNNFL